jgi:ankyrin repeat protein
MYHLRNALAGTGLAILLVSNQASAVADNDMLHDLSLVDAARKGQVATLQMLLDGNDVNVNVAQVDGTTALVWAVYNDNLKITELLLDAGADVNAATDLGITPLHLACDNKNDVMVNKLLVSGADPNKSGFNGQTPLMNCIHTGAVNAVKALVAHGADVNASEHREEQTALMWAVAGKQPDMVKILVDAGANINARSKFIEEPEPFIIQLEPGDTIFGTNFAPNVRFPEVTGGFTPIYFAAQQGDIESALILLSVEGGADVDDPHPEHGSPLIVALASGHEQMALFLLEQGADVNVKDAWGLAPLHYAVHEGLLVISNFRPSRTDVMGWRRRNMPAVQKELLARGADPDPRMKYSFSHLNDPFLARSGEEAPQVDPVGATPLMMAAISSDIESIQILLDGGADPTLTTVGGATLFMLAAGVGSERGTLKEAQAIDAAKFVMTIKGAGGVNDYLKEKAIDGGHQWKGKEDRRTAAHAAAHLGWRNMLRFLADNDANLDAADRYGMTPLEIALGDPVGRYYRQIGKGNYDDRFRRPAAEGLGQPAVAKLLVDLGATPFTGTYRDRSGE